MERGCLELDGAAFAAAAAVMAVAAGAVVVAEVEAGAVAEAGEVGVEAAERRCLARLGSADSALRTTGPKGGGVV